MGEEIFILISIALFAIAAYSKIKYEKLGRSSSNPNLNVNQPNSTEYLSDRKRSRHSKKQLCPHPAFVAKHIVNLDSDETADPNYIALKKEKIRKKMRTSRTKTQSLFYAPEMTYHQEENNCIFDTPATEFVCQSDKSKQSSTGWSCRKKGQGTASHSVFNGHYYWANTKNDEKNNIEIKNLE